MRRFILAAIAVLLSSSAMADMFPDASNAKLPEAQDNLGIARSVTAYGAKCDGTTDDTAALQAAINANQTSVTGATVPELRLPEGSCFTGTLTISGQLHLTGHAGTAGSRLVLKNLTTTPMFIIETAGSYVAPPDPRIVLRNLQLVAAGNTNTGPGVGTSHGIDLRPGSYRITLELDGVVIFNFGGSGLNRSLPWLGAVLVKNSQFVRNQYGVTNTSGSDWSFNNSQMYLNYKDGISWSGGGYGYFNSVAVYSNGEHGVTIFGDTPSNVWIGGSIDRNGQYGLNYTAVTKPCTVARKLVPTNV